MITLPEIPSRIARLPRDERGYPVPWFVSWIDGKPEFRCADGRKFGMAIKHKLCWVCGQRLGNTHRRTYRRSPSSKEVSRGGLLFHVGDPKEVKWFAEGRAAKREEIVASMESGLPILMDMARKEGTQAIEELGRYYERALTLVPA